MIHKDDLLEVVKVLFPNEKQIHQIVLNSDECKIWAMLTEIKHIILKLLKSNLIEEEDFIKYLDEVKIL